MCDVNSRPVMDGNHIYACVISHYLARVEQVLELAKDPRPLPPTRLGIDEDE